MTAQVSFDFTGTTVLITGGTSGIGEMIARGFLDAGAVVLVASRKVDVGEALVEELSKTGSFTFIQANLSTEAIALNASR